MRAVAILLATMLLSAGANAEVALSVGTGKGIVGEHGVPFERTAAVGYQLPFGDFFVRPEGGYFLDISGQGASSLYAAPLLGVSTHSSNGPELHVAVGPGYLQNPDQVLGGHFQFSLEGGLGISDGKNYLGLAWKHLSSAGFEMPNHGRDFITLQWRIIAL
jgi:Lipid A 3-O-deacylase (PagL)